MFNSHRKADHPILPLILNRWSPRAMTGEEIDDALILSLFEAARWAPSCYNNQPWKFLYAKKGTSHFNTFFSFLVDFNKSWCEKAALLGVIAAETLFEKNKKPSITHALDTGAAWENLALEGNSRNLVVHGM
jgi:nitroreductase